MPDGTVQERSSGTPQGGVISPVLANLYMHYAFDVWMERNHSKNPWVRYADDGVIHCRTKEEAEQLRARLEERLAECKLEMHPDKTRIVHCRSGRCPRRSEHESFDFLGYTFRRRLVKSKTDNFFTGFTPAVSKGAAQTFRDSIREIRKTHRTVSLEELADVMNPVIRGWANYFSEFCPSEARKVLDYVNLTLVQWIRRRYKSVKRSTGKSFRWIARVAKANPSLFYHWTMGIRPTMG